MIVGEQVRIRGTIEGDEDIVVHGRLEGSVQISGALVVEPTGEVIADVVAREVKVNGLLRGNVSALNHIEVTRTGRMAGDAIAPAVSIAAGATFRGRMEMGDPQLLEAVPIERRALGREGAPGGIERRALSRDAGLPVERRALPGEAAAAPPPAPPVPSTLSMAEPPLPETHAPPVAETVVMARETPLPAEMPEIPEAPRVAAVAHGAASSPGPGPAPASVPERSAPRLARPRSGRLQRRGLS